LGFGVRVNLILAVLGTSGVTAYEVLKLVDGKIYVRPDLRWCAHLIKLG
jgi:hypothetical protein